MTSLTMTHEETREALTILSRWFELPSFDLIWSTRTRRGSARYFRNAIKLGPRCWRGTTDSLLHEFAHLFAIYRARQITGSALDGKGHGRHFQETLHMVAAAWYGDPRKYAWHTEYKNVFAYARREGIYKLEPSMLSKVIAELTFSNTTQLHQHFEMAGPTEREHT